MAKYKVLDNFYKSDAWINFRELYIVKRIKKENGSYCDYCGKSIDSSSDTELHHVEELTPDNYQDPLIALNEDNIKQLHKGCHNSYHKHAKQKAKRAFIVYGPPCAGKNYYVNNRLWPGDIIVDMDSLYQAVSGRPRYDKPDILLFTILNLQDHLFDVIETRNGKWDNAWIIGGYPDKYKRERLAKRLGAEIIYIETTQEECISRLVLDPERSHRIKEWSKYIAKWFDNYIK